MFGGCCCLPSPLPFVNDWQHWMCWNGIPWSWGWGQSGMSTVTAAGTYVCTGIRQSLAVFKPVRTLRQTLMRVKTHIPEDRKRGVVYEVPHKECHQTYIGETKRMLKVRLGEHEQVMKHVDPKNGIAVHTHELNHTIDWDGTRVKSSGMTGYWQRRTIEAIHIKLSEKTMYLDGGLQLPTIWNPVLKPP